MRWAENNQDLLSEVPHVCDDRLVVLFGPGRQRHAGYVRCVARDRREPSNRSLGSTIFIAAKIAFPLRNFAPGPVRNGADPDGQTPCARRYVGYCSAVQQCPRSRPPQRKPTIPDTGFACKGGCGVAAHTSSASLHNGISAEQQRRDFRPCAWTIRIGSEGIPDPKPGRAR